MRNGLRTWAALAISGLSASAASAQQTPYPAPPPIVTGTSYRPAPAATRPADRKIVNTTNVQVEYRIDTVGPSGVGRVDLYVTPDGGSTWTKVGEDADKASPANVTLPREGVFGVRLAIVNGNGFGGKAPKAGDRPQFSVEVDATSPQVNLQPCEVVAGGLDIRWSATDANLGAEPVHLFYRTRSDQAWQPIARNLRNDGAYRWAFPGTIGAQVFLKVEVIDAAGNATKVETPNPINIDQTEPEATLVDVIGVNARPAPSAIPSPALPPSLPSLPPPLPQRR